MRLFELYEVLEGGTLPCVPESEFTFPISPELLDLLVKLELRPETDQEVLDLLAQMVPESENVSFSIPDSVAENYVVTPSTRALVLFAHKVLTLPRANKFLKSLLNILSMAESSSSQNSLLKTSSNIVEEGDDISETQSNRWRHLQNQQQQLHLTGARGGVRRSKHLIVHDEQPTAPSEEASTTMPGTAPSTPAVVGESAMPVSPNSALPELADLNRSVGTAPISEQERSDIEQRMQSSFQADGPNSDVWEQKMRPPIVGGVELQLSNKQITDPDALLRASSHASPLQNKRKEAKKKVPYAEHQVMFPGNFFRYPVLEASQYPEEVSFVKLSPTHWPAWLSVCMSSSAQPASVQSSRECVRVPLRALMMVFNSTGGELPLVETTLCQSLFRNFVLHCQEEQLLNYENYVTLIMREFPWFANLPRSKTQGPASDPYTKASKAEMDMFNLYTKMEALRWTAATYQAYAERLLAAGGDGNQLDAFLEDVERDLRNSILLNLDTSLVHIERILINMLGHSESKMREKATIFLNCLYDRHAWQLRHPFVPRVRCIDDSFSVEICFQDSISEELMNRLIVAVSSPTAGSHRQITYHVPTQYGNSLLVELSSFKRAGFYDWAIGYVSSTGIHFYPLGGFVPPSEEDFWTDVREQLVESHGRFVVHPAIRQDIFHEIFVDIEGAVWDRIHGGPVKRFGTFTTIRRALDDYVENDGITAIYIMGAQERAEFGRGHPFSPIDRSRPNRASGGLDMFVELMKAAKERQLKVLVDATARISIRGAHRRYRGLNCSVLDTESGMLHVAHASDGGEQTWKDCQQLNYRKQSAWDIYIADILAWAQLGVDGVRIESAHCCPLILRPDTKELERMDCDGQYHYDWQEIMDGDVVLPSTDEAYSYGFFGTRAYEEGYPNPFFVKITSAIWQHHPQFIFTAEVYWNRQRSSIASGLIPFSTGISQALSSVFGTGRGRDGAFGRLPYRRDVKAFYDWYEMERTSYPQNSLVMYASSNHYCPYPVTLYGRGAWSAVDLLYFLPEVPATFVGEHGGWSFEYDMSTNSFRRSGIDHSFSSLAEIRGHYVHRVRLRKRISVLNDGGLILLYAKVNDKNWHDRVFAFARFKLDKMAIIAINFNDVESTFYIDYSPLRRLFGPGNIYKREDLINPHHQPMYFSLEELLNERQQVTLQPYKSMCWGIYKEIDSPAARRVLFEHSFRRLATNLEQGVDPAHNLVYSDFQTSFREGIDQFDQFVATLTQQLPRTSLNLFPTLIRNATALSVKTQEEESKLLATLEYLRAKKEQTTDEASGLLVDNIYQQILQCNRLGPLVFVTPEIGRFSKVGGIAVMVDELTQALQALGCEVILISPYYNYDRKGATGYLKREGVTHLKNIVAFVGNEPIEVGVHELKENGITYYFIHHFEYFPTPYHAGSSMHQLKTIVLMAKASLELCCQLRILPAVIISNDWFTGLVPAYGRKSSAFGTTFEGVTFFHLVHNLEEGYEGKIYLDGHDHLGYIHHLPREIVVDPSCEQLCLNASRCALLSCNQWGTVSKSYCKDLMEGLNPSPLRHYLAAFPAPFAHSNGVRVDQRLEELKTVATSRAEAKAKLQEKYFGKADAQIPLLSFVGRICLQKGVHLILNAVRELIDTHAGRIQIIVGGMANYKDPYAAQCAWTMQGLRSTYSENFWADPNEFFTDGPLLNMGSDFALMPSLFEPSGVVQQEYFLGGTPVIAFKTGGLKDTVFEGPEGNGFTFEAHTHRDYVDAVNRALRLFQNTSEFEELCHRARESVLDMEVVAQAWAREFSRLRKCIWYDRKQVAQQLALLQEERPLSTPPQPSF